jgi:hypothetical protein
MNDEPQNLTLRLLREMREETNRRFDEVNRRFDGMHGEQESIAALLGKVVDAVTAIAATQERHSELLGKLYEIQLNNGARLNAIDGRLAIIEKHTGLVKA